MLFSDRPDAGVRLASHLQHLRTADAIVLGIPRGGVPVAAVVAHALEAPLDVILVRKLGAPRNPEYAIGAIGEGGVRIADASAVRAAGVSEADLAVVEQAERRELDRRAQRFRGDRPRLDLTGRTAIVVDDGVATGSTAAAACRVARGLGADRVVLAVPVAPADSSARLTDECDELIVAETPPNFFAVGQWYTDFRQTTDEEVIALIAAS